MPFKESARGQPSEDSNHNSQVLSLLREETPHSGLADIKMMTPQPLKTEKNAVCEAPPSKLPQAPCKLSNPLLEGVVLYESSLFLLSVALDSPHIDLISKDQQTTGRLLEPRRSFCLRRIVMTDFA